MENTSITDLPEPYGPVNTEHLLRVLKHFATCLDVPARTELELFWGQLINVGDKQYRLDFIQHAFGHLDNCEAGQAEFGIVIDTSAITDNLQGEQIMPEPYGQPQEPTRVLDLASSGLDGVILVVESSNCTDPSDDPDGSNSRYYDLTRVAQMIPHMQLSRNATINLGSKVTVIEASLWEIQPFEPGDQLSLYEITNGQHLVIGEYAYAVADVKRFLEHHSPELLVQQPTAANANQTPTSSGPRHAAPSSHNEHEPAWYSPEYKSTGLTELPAAAEEEYEDDIDDDPETPEHDDEFYDRPVDADNDTVVKDAIASFDKKRWLTSPFQRAFFGLMLALTWITTIAATIAGTYPHYSHSLAGDICTAALATIVPMVVTPAVGIFGAYLVGRRPVNLDFIVEEDRQRVLGFAGATIAWGLLVLIDLFILLNN